MGVPQTFKVIIVHCHFAILTERVSTITIIFVSHHVTTFEFNRIDSTSISIYVSHFCSINSESNANWDVRNKNSPQIWTEYPSQYLSLSIFKIQKYIYLSDKTAADCSFFYIKLLFPCGFPADKKTVGKSDMYIYNTYIYGLSSPRRTW